MRPVTCRSYKTALPAASKLSIYKRIKTPKDAIGSTDDSLRGTFINHLDGFVVVISSHLLN